MVRITQVHKNLLSYDTEEREKAAVWFNKAYDVHGIKVDTMMRVWDEEYLTILKRLCQKEEMIVPLEKMIKAREFWEYPPRVFEDKIKDNIAGYFNLIDKFPDIEVLLIGERFLSLTLKSEHGKENLQTYIALLEKEPRTSLQAYLPSEEQSPSQVP